MNVIGSCTFTMNYLVYLQNLVLNGKRDEKNTIIPQLKFPYFDFSSWGMLTGDSFAQEFKQSWSQVVDHLATNGERADDLVLTNLEDELFRRLFQDDEVGVRGLLESYKSFLAWWQRYPVGGQYILSTVTNDQIQSIAEELRARSGSGLPDQRVTLELVYDEFPLGEVETRPNYVVVPVVEVMMPKYREKLLGKLQQAIV